jgi:hypothetical protein
MQTKPKAGAQRRRRAIVTPTEDVRQFFRPEAKLAPREPDLKTAGASASFAAVTSAGTLVDCFAPAQGASSVQRIGDQCTLKGVEVGLQCAGTQSTRAAGRAILFQWNNDSTNDPPTTATVIQNGTPALVVIAPYTVTAINQMDMTVIADWCFDIAPLVNSGNSGPAITQIWHKKFEFESQVGFNSAATSGVGKVYLLLLSDQAASGPNMAYYVQCNFVDS